MPAPGDRRRKRWLTPQEVRNLAWMAALFLLGVAVRWLRQNGYL